MSLALRDQTIAGMRKEVQKRREMLLDKMREIGKTHEDNPRLKEISEAYRTYFETELERKEKQKNALIALSEHIDELVADNNIALAEARYHQKDILREIRTIEKEKNKILRALE